MAQELNIEQKLADLLATRDFQPETLGKDGRTADESESTTFSFDYVSGSGKNYGTMVIVMGNDNEMIIMYGDNLGKTMERNKDRSEFFEFQQQLMTLAKRNRWKGTLLDISNLARVRKTMAASIKEGLFEGYYGNRRTSYSGEPTEARLVINHNRVLGENDKRYRYVESLFIETADRERYKLQFTNLAAGRAMLEHVRQGGKPYDIRGSHINNMVTEMKVLNRFNRASQGRVMEGVTQEITEQAHLYYQSLRESMKRMGTPRGYAHYFESWHPAEIGEQEELVENIKTMFIEQTLDSRIEEALPLLARIQQQGDAMKEADIFESWINRLAEGTWLTPDTGKQVLKLKELLSKDLIVGPDATNAKMLLGDIVGDDILEDRLEELAHDSGGKANAWNDTVIMARLKELGIDTSPQEPAGVLPDGTEPVDAETAGTEPGVQPEAPVAPTPDMPQEPPMAPIRESESLNAIRKAAGLPVVESVLTDSTGHTLDHILKSFGREVRDFKESGDLNHKLYQALKAYYHEDMPYDIKNDADGQDSYKWIADRLSTELGVNEGAAVDAYMAGKSPALAHFADQLDKSEEKPLAECNMTMEGEYCPEHGLMECGGMYEMGTVAGSMAPVMGVPESTNNGIVINGKEVDKASLEVDGVDSRDYPDFSDAYFSAGSFTDGTPLSDEEIDQLSDQYGDLLYDKAYDSLHEGNTLLARIKSLALIR